MHQSFPIIISRVVSFRTSVRLKFQSIRSPARCYGTTFPVSAEVATTASSGRKFHHLHEANRYQFAAAFSQQAAQATKPFIWGSNKKHRDIKLKLQLLQNMTMDPKIETILAPLREAVKEQVWFSNQILRIEGQI